VRESQLNEFSHVLIINFFHLARQNHNRNVFLCLPTTMPCQRIMRKFTGSKAYLHIIISLESCENKKENQPETDVLFRNIRSIQLNVDMHIYYEGFSVYIRHTHDFSAGKESLQKGKTLSQIQFGTRPRRTALSPHRLFYTILLYCIVPVLNRAILKMLKLSKTTQQKFVFLLLSVALHETDEKSGWSSIHHLQCFINKPTFLISEVYACTISKCINNMHCGLLYCTVFKYRYGNRSNEITNSNRRYVWYNEIANDCID